MIFWTKTKEEESAIFDKPAETEITFVSCQVSLCNHARHQESDIEDTDVNEFKRSLVKFILLSFQCKCFTAETTTVKMHLWIFCRLPPDTEVCLGNVDTRFSCCWAQCKGWVLVCMQITDAICKLEFWIVVCYVSSELWNVKQNKQPSNYCSCVFIWSVLCYSGIITSQSLYCRWLLYKIIRSINTKSSSSHILNSYKIYYILLNLLPESRSANRHCWKTREILSCLCVKHGQVAAVTCWPPR